MGMPMSGPEPGAPRDASDDIARQLRLASFGSCGSRIAPHPDAGLLRLSVSLPTTRPRASDKTSYLPIDLSLRNLTDSTVQVRTYRSGARMAITKDGVVVAGADGVRPAATQYTIEPGAARAYTSTVGLVSCETNVGLAPGEYQLHALQPFTFLDKDSNAGLTINVYGGPWELEIR
jgi:hypothetical protein